LECIKQIKSKPGFCNGLSKVSQKEDPAHSTLEILRGIFSTLMTNNIVFSMSFSFQAEDGKLHMNCPCGGELAFPFFIQMTSPLASGIHMPELFNFAG